ncbi:MAG TPA: CsgG/HfaB family protein [Tepidisphaeraceae bacterium]|jgi:curli biogenesis system outer membrane secretion channel CsgG
MFSRTFVRLGAGVALMLGGLAVVGCSSSHESAGQDALTANVGKYSPAPQGVNKPKVGVPPFNVQTAGGISNNGDLNSLAADQMTTLLDQSERFHVIERAQLQKLLDEQNLEGIVKPGELAKPGQVRGVDYLLLGKVTNLRVKHENKGNEFGLAQLGNIAGGAAVNNKETVITTECGVDIRLVDPTTGELMTSNFSEFKRTDSAKSMGLAILGANAQSNADIQLSEDDKGKILRLALDDALRKSLPKIDQFLQNQPAKPSSAAPAPSNNTAAGTPAAPASPVSNPTDGVPPAPSSPSPEAVAAKKFCPNCGAPNDPNAKFCAKCGHKLD